MTIIQAVEEIANYLSNCFKKDKFYIQYKSTTNPEEFETKTPEIYIFTCPSSSLKEGYPSRCPSIVLTLDGRDDYTYDITVNLCISSASLSKKEVATKNNDGSFTVGEYDGELHGIGADNKNVDGSLSVGEVEQGKEKSDIKCDTEADVDLVIESILFTDQICNYIYNFTELNISNIAVEYPDVNLPDSPYAISAVSFKVSVNLEHRDQNPYNDLY